MYKFVRNKGFDGIFYSLKVKAELFWTAVIAMVYFVLPFQEITDISPVLAAGSKTNFLILLVIVFTKHP